MVMLPFAPPGALEEYHAGIQLLNARYPSAWGSIFQMDEAVRSDQWGRLCDEWLEGTLMVTPDFKEDLPWSWIIQNSRFGSPGPRWQWWDDRVYRLAHGGQSLTGSGQADAPLLALPWVGGKRGRGGKGKDAGGAPFWDEPRSRF